jgi:ABC-type uncharacterized transport system permease subunit
MSWWSELGLPILADLVYVGAPLVWAGATIYLYRRTRSPGAILLLIHGLLSAAAVLGRFFPAVAVLRSQLGPGLVWSLRIVVHMLWTLLSYGLLVAGALLLASETGSLASRGQERAVAGP